MIRDYGGHFISTYATNLGTCSVLQAELRGILVRVRLACEIGKTSLIMESDSMLAITLLKSGCGDHHPQASLIREIKRVMSQA